MKILFDTSVLIDIEDPKELSQNLQELLTIIRDNSHSPVVHTYSFADIENDKNEKRKNLILSKLKGYPRLEGPVPDQRFIDSVGPEKNKNDIVDNRLLFAIYKNAANFLVTLDGGIIHKAKLLSLEDKVLTPNQALAYLRKLHKRELPTHTLLQEKSLYNLDINDSFFDSLKEDYGTSKFESWFSRISREGRKGWAYLDEDNRIRALLVLKDENETVESIPPLSKSKRLKICTLKVDLKGSKIGELFLKMAFQYCVDNRFLEIYCTHFEKENDSLISLLQEFGFKKHGKKFYEIKDSLERFEKVWLRTLSPMDKDKNLDPLSFSKNYYPVYKDSKDVRKFLVPVKPMFHNRLFPDYKNRQMNLSDYTEINQVGNAIKKAYLCHAKIRKIRPGDILIFYRSEDQTITSLGVVESAETLEKTKDIVERVGVRTVYSYKEINDMTKKPVLVLLFRHHFNLPRAIQLSKLKESEVIKAAPQSIIEIDDERYKKLKSLSGINEDFTVN